MNSEIVVSVCMGTGGIAAGGDMVMEAFEKEFEEAGVANATVKEQSRLHKVGCRGFCARDVLVDISVNGIVSTYQYIQADMVINAPCQTVTSRMVSYFLSIHERLNSQ